MDIFFMVLALIAFGGFFYVITRKGTLDIDGDGDVDVDDAVAAAEMIVEEVVDLANMTKNELLEYAASKDIEIPKSWNKAKILAKLEV
jgi:hypothetical protein